MMDDLSFRERLDLIQDEKWERKRERVDAPKKPDLAYKLLKRALKFWFKA